MRNRQWLLKTRPVGLFKASDFELHEQELPPLKDGQVLIKNLYLSFDPTQRGWASIDTYLPVVNLGEVMRALGVGQVVESKSSSFKKGDLVFGLVNWQECFVYDTSLPSLFPLNKVPPYIDIPRMIALSLTGLTAFFGLREIGKPKAGETVVVSGAAGATGSIAGQLTKLKGCRTIGIAGGQDKCKWVKEVARFDEVIDYKSENVAKRLKELCPKGVDVYFDNVGGEILDAVLANLALHARIICCGQISQYNAMASLSDPGNSYGLRLTAALIIQRAKMQGFIVSDYAKDFPKGLLYLNSLVENNKITQEIDIQEGFENIPATLIRLFEGKNLGKQLLKLSAPAAVNQSAIGKLLFKTAQAFAARRY